MIHGNFANLRARMMRQHWHEAVKSVECEQRLQHRSFEGAKAAACIAEIDAQNRFARRPGDARRHAAEKIVLPCDTHSADEIVIGQSGEQSRQISGIILQVAIERGNDGRFSRTEPGPQRGALAGVAPMAHSTNARLGLMRRFDLLPCSVGAGIIDKDKLNRASFRLERRKNLFGERGHVVGLVEQGNND